MKKLSRRLKDGRREIQEKMPRPNKMAPSNIPHGATSMSTINGAAETSDVALPNNNVSSAVEVPHNPPPATQAAEGLGDRGPAIGHHDSALDLELDDFDLAPRTARTGELFLLERKSLLMFSKAHMRIIIQDFMLLRKFAAFLVESKPEGAPILAYHLDCRKALAAIKYSNTIAGGLSLTKSALDSGIGDTPPAATVNEELQRRAEESFQRLASEYLPVWVTNVWVKAVEVSIRMRITGSLPSQLKDMSEGLAETFCLSDPSRRDNPMLFASEGFIKLTQYPNDYTIGRNCRMLRGPRTNTHGTRRLSRKLGEAQEHHEAVLNYRRDGTPFMNLLMVTPLLDAHGKTRYFLGSQIDVSGLLDDFYGFEYLHKFFDREGYVVKDEEEDMASSFDAGRVKKDGLRELSELLTSDELDLVRMHGGRLHRLNMEDAGSTQEDGHESRLVLSESTQDALEEKREGRLVLTDSPTNEHSNSDDWDDIFSHGKQATSSTTDTPRLNGQRSIATLPNGPQSAAEEDHIEKNALNTADDQASVAPSFEALAHGGHLGCGLYDHYLLVRPAPSLRILFASPSLRSPGIVQSQLMERVGGSAQMRSRIEQALTRGRRVTAKIKWMPPSHRGGQAASPTSTTSAAENTARSRWLHATPLLGKDSEVGVWMVVLVDEERSLRGSALEQEAWSERMDDEISRPRTASSVSVSVAGGTRSFLKSSHDPASIILGLNSARNKGAEGSVAGSEAPAPGDLEP